MTSAAFPGPVLGGQRRAIVMRADVSPHLGTGHLRRCLTLGEALCRAGLSVYYLIKGTLPAWTAQIGRFAAGWADIEADADPLQDATRTAAYCRRVGASCLVVDHYAANEAYQLVLLEAGLKWMQFDGAAAMPLWADWVVSMSPAAEASAYERLRRREETRLLLGPQYAIVRDEFRRMPATSPVREVPRQLLMTFGGGDDRGATILCLEGLAECFALQISVFVSSYAPQATRVGEWLQCHGNMSARLYLDAKDMARHMAQADVAVTAGGTTTFEAALLGVPSLIVQIADNQKANAESWQRLGVAVDLGAIALLNAQRLRRELSRLLADKSRRQEMARAGRRYVDGRGADRLVQELCSACLV